MLTKVLSQLESLQADLARIDPEGEIDAADRVAALALELRDIVRSVERARDNETERQSQPIARAG